MPRSRLPVLAILAALALLWIAPALSEPVIYTCTPPKTGTEPMFYLWYVCYPDSNTANFYRASVWSMIGIETSNPGQRMRVRAIDARGRLGPLSVASLPWQPAGKSMGAEGVAQASLLPNYPNPFNPRTTIAFSLPEPARARVDIYDAAGRLVRELVNADLPGGTNRVVWDGTDAEGRAVASGTYLCRMASGKTTEMRRLLLVR